MTSQSKTETLIQELEYQKNPPLARPINKFTKKIMLSFNYFGIRILFP